MNTPDDDILGELELLESAHAALLEAEVTHEAADYVVLHIPRELWDAWRFGPNKENN